MSDPYIMRDGEGNPLSSIFHKPPIKTWVPKSMRDIVKVFDNVFPPITEFHTDEIKGDEKKDGV